MTTHRPAGFTLIELAMVLVVIGIGSSLALPSLNGLIRQIRTQSALDVVVGEIYRARMLAVRDGYPVSLVLAHGAAECIDRVVIVTGAPDRPRRWTRPLAVPGVCLDHTGDSVLVFNSRGMLRPPARSIFIANLPTTDSVKLSIAGRIRRNY